MASGTGSLQRQMEVLRQVPWTREVGTTMALLQHVRDLTTGDRIGEAVYAVWMLVVSIGLINATGNPDDPAAVLFAVIAATLVNVTWGLIDGITMMYSSVISRAQADRLVYALRTKRDDPAVRGQAADALEEGLAGSLSEEDRTKVVAMIAAGPVPPDPSLTKYRTTRGDRSIAYGILIIECLFILPMLLPILFIPSPRLGAFVSYLLGAGFFGFLGAQYARHLNRNQLIPLVLMGGLMALLAYYTYSVGW